MLVVEIDRVDAQPLKARVAGAADIFRRAIDAADSAGTDPEAKLGRNHDALARHLAQESPKQFLILVGAVHFGRIQEVAAKLKIPAKDSKRFLIIPRSISKGHSHASKSQGGNLRSIFSQFSVFHISSPLCVLL